MTFKVGDYGWVWDGVQWTSWRSLNSDRDQQKPLLGSTLFIWIKRFKLDEAELLRNIQVLGGRVSKFLDDAVSFVVTDQDPTKVPAPQHKPPREEPLALSRGQLILSRAHKSTEAAAGNTEDCVIDRVREARIRLWNISQFLRWVEVHLNIQPAPAAEPAPSRKRKASRLPRPLVKVEDVEQEFKPVYKVFKSDPALYVNSLYPSSPFDDPAVQDRYVQIKKSGRVPSCDSDSSDKPAPVNAATNKPQQNATPPAPAKHQYCECCNAYFYNLQQHIGPDGAHHREFALREDNFECVKELIDCFPSLDELVSNGDHGMEKALSEMHPSAYHFAMLNAAGMQASAAAYHRPPPVSFPSRPSFDPAQVMVKQEPQDDSPPSTMHHPGLMSGVGEAGAAVPLDFSRTSQLSDICGQSFPREYVHHHQGPPPLIPHPPYLPDKSEEPQSCWMSGAAKMDTGSGGAATMPPPPHLSSHHSQGAPQVSTAHHLPLENLSFLDPPQQDAMFTSELPQPDFSFGLQNLLHSICDETEDEHNQRRSGGSRGVVDGGKEHPEKVAESAPAPTSLIPEQEPQQQQYPPWPYSESTSTVAENTRSHHHHQQQPSVENSSSSPLELTAHTPSEAPSSSGGSKQAAGRRRHSRDDEDAASNGMSESNPNRWTVERTRRGVGLKLKFTPARKQSSSLLSPPTPVQTPRTPKAAKSASSSFDVYDWNEEEEGECSDFVKVQWRVMHTEDTKVILCRTKQFALPRKHGKGVGGGKQLVY